MKNFVKKPDISSLENDRLHMWKYIIDYNFELFAKHLIAAEDSSVFASGGFQV